MKYFSYYKKNRKIGKIIIEKEWRWQNNWNNKKVPEINGV